MFGIAKALLASGVTPNNTIVICAMAAEEWGVVDSNFDWSTGAYEQVFTAHPEWVGKVIADLNFELPALAHGTRARIRSCYEYTRFLEEYLSELPDLTQAYPEETRVTSPIETWSDDFSMAIAGIPSMVNDFTGGSLWRLTITLSLITMPFMMSRSTGFIMSSSLFSSWLLTKPASFRYAPLRS